MTIFVKDRGAWHEIPKGGTPAGLPGLGGWADVTAVTGNPTKHEYTDADGNDWTAYEWTANGDVTVTDGLLDRLVVGPGGHGGGGDTRPGGGGGVVLGVTLVAAGSIPITVGTAGAASRMGGKSSLGPLDVAGPGGDANLQISATIGPMGGGAGDNAGHGGGGAGGDASKATGHGGKGGVGVVSRITGVSLEYGHGGDKGTVKGTAPGYGGPGNGNIPGNNGVVIIRVPRAHALA